jgi:hypothetical protein
MNPQLQQALYSAFHQGAMKPREIARMLKVSYNYLARACMAGKSRVAFPIHWLPDFIKITGRVEPLKIISNSSGYLLSPIPLRSVPTEKEVLAMMSTFSQAMQALATWARNPGDKLAMETIAQLTRTQEEIEYWKRLIQSPKISK